MPPMTDELTVLVSQIQRKSENLVKKIHQLDVENRQLKTRLQESEAVVDIYKQKLKELESKYSILKVSGSINRNNSKQEAQKAQDVIDRLIKEIDACLKLLDQ